MRGLDHFFYSFVFEPLTDIYQATKNN